MRKTGLFIFITVLLATLFMTVACDSTPVSVKNGLVRASISLGGEEKGLIVTGGDSSISSYKIALIHEWEATSMGDSIHGGIGSRDINGTITYGSKPYSANNSSIDLGYLSMGMWTVYIQGLNKNGNLVYSGNATTYFNNTNQEVVVFLKRVTEGESVSLEYDIQLNQLAISESFHTTNYKVFIQVKNNDETRSVVAEKEIIPSITSSTDGSVPYVSYNSTVEGNPQISLPQGSYVVTISLKEYDDASSSWNTVGGISRMLNVVSGEKAIIKGVVAPSDFVTPDLSIPSPTIDAQLTTVPAESSQKKDNVLQFVCTDMGNDKGEYNRTFHWFIEGEEVVDASMVTTDNENGTSTLNFTFTSYGLWEVSCMVVYSPSNSSAVKFCGQDSYTVKIIPRV